MDPNTDSREGSDSKDHPTPGGTHADTAGDKQEFTEAFEELKFPELEFSDKWTLWEQYETKDSKNYSDTMQKVGCFNDPVSFWKVWNTVPHSNPVNYAHYFDEDDYKTTVAKHYVINDNELKISAVSLFKTGIVPAWEDPVNAKGGEFSVKVKCHRDQLQLAKASGKAQNGQHSSLLSDVKSIWESIILEVISSNFPGSDQV